ncbi:MAG: SIR2 family NAD-dependent protein deacylase [Phototrophicaceae bacterium]
MPLTLDAALEQATTILKAAKTVCAFSGAGMSQESGIPTFRDAQVGMWANYDPTQLATPRAFQANPKLVWDWYEERRQKLVTVQPNAGHVALGQLEKRFGQLPVITQNIDDLHERGGSSDVIHLHGRLQEHKCFYNCQGNPTLVDLATLTFDPNDTPPTCPHCGRKSVRVNVVWFEEALSPADLERAQDIAATHDVMLMIGTSGAVYPANQIPKVAKVFTNKVIEINPNVSELTPLVDVRIPAPSGVALPKLLELLNA